MTGTWDAQGLTVSGNPVLTGFNSGQFITTGQTGSFVSTGITGNAFYPRFGNPAGYITASQAGGVNSLIVTGTALSGAITISGAGGISVLTGYAGQNIIAVSGWDTGQYITTAMTGRFVTTGQTGQFVTTGQTGQFVTSAQTGQFLTTANNRVTSITVTGASLTGNVTLTGVGGLNVSLSGNVVLISGGATSSSISNAVTGISVTGSYTLTGTVSFQQTGGIRMFVSGSTITFSGVSGNVTNNITNNNFINSGSGLYVYQTQLSTGSDIQFIPFPVTLDPNATVVTSIQNASSDIILGSQISGITTTGYWLTLSDTPLNTGYFVHSHVCNSSGTGLATTVINNYSNDYTYVVFTTGNQAISGLKNFINTGRFERIEVAGRIQNTTGDLVLMVANSQSGYGVYISGGQAQPTNINGGPVVIRGGDALNGFGGHVRITAGIGDLLFPGGHGGGDVVVTAGFGDDSSGGSVYLAGGAGVVTNGYVIADNLIVSGSGNFSGLYVNNTPVLTGFNSGEYVTLNTVQTITNNKTFSADTYFGSIYGNGGAPTRINLNNGNWYDINDDSSIGVNTRALRYSGDRLNWNTRSLTGTWDAQGLTISGISVLTGFNSGQYLTGPYGVTSLIVTGFVWSGTAITGQRYSGNVILSGVAGITVITGAQYTGNNVIIISGIANQTGQFLTSANVVFTTGNQSITGSKTFNLPIICPSVLDSNTDASVAVDGRKLYNTSSSYTVDWQNRILEDSSSHAINWGNKHLIDDDDTTSLDWHNRRLYSHWLVSGNLNVTGNITASGNHVLSGNAGDILTVINGSFAQQSNAIRGRGTGNSDNAWQGRVVGGGTGAAIFIGEGNGKGVLGVHNYAMDAWRDLYLNYGGTATCYIGDGIGDGNVSLPVLTVKNTSGVVGVANAIPSAVFDISGINANVVPLKIQRYPGVNANLTEWINNTGVVIPRLVAFVSPSGLISGSNMVVGGSGNFLQGLFINGVPVSTGASSATVTNVVFTTGAQRVSGHKTMLSGMNVSGRFTVNNTATNTIGDVAGDSIVQESFLGTLSANGYEWIFDIYAYKSGSAGRVYSNTPYRFDVFDDGSTDSFRWNITWNAVPGALGYRVVIVNDDYVGIYGDDSVDTATNQLYYDDTALYNGNANVQFSSPWTEIFPAITSSGINTLSGHLNVLGTTHFKADVNITGGLFITGNADTTAYITNYSTIQQANALRLQGVGSSASVWKGRLVAGGETVAFIMGEFANKAWLGAHNAALNAWADFYVNPGGDNNCYIGDDIGDGVTLRPIITVRNNGGTAGFRHHTPTAVVDISGTSTSSVVPLRINRYSGAAAYLTEWNNVTGNGWTKTTVAAVTNSGMFSGANLFIGGSGNFMQGLYISGIPVNTGASSASVTNVVFTTGNQSISGQKIFLTGMIVSGDVTISGHLSATTKSFLINHPTKSGQKLQYGVLEGPEHAVYARGKTNENYVMLPDYWVNLVNPDSITVNLTPLGVRQNLYVEAVSVSGISVNQEGSGYYYYHVFAERKDVPRLEVEF
jgi:hypothetical protein